MPENPLRQLEQAGQSVWFDYIRRWEMVSGHLKRLIDEDGISGVTSNPSIFEKAVVGSQDYDETLRRLAYEGREAEQIFEALAEWEFYRSSGCGWKNCWRVGSSHG